MADDTENPPAPSAGVLARLAAKFGVKSESEVVAELKAENAVLTSAANEAQAELEVSRAEVARQGSIITGLQSKFTAVEAVIPGITASADPAALLTQTVTQKTAEQVSAMGMDPGKAPGTEPAPEGGKQSLDEQFAECKTPEEKNAFLKAHGSDVFKK